MTQDRSKNVSRRRAMQTGAGLIGAATLGVPSLAASAFAEEQSERAADDSGFRFAFMPDFHLRRDLRSADGMAKALQVVSALEPRPAFIVTGGDLIHDMRSQTPDECEEMAALFTRIWSDNTDIPVHHASATTISRA